MGSWRNLAVFAAATCVALGAAREAGATASDFYGNNFDENILVPFAQCGPGGNDTLFAITNPGVPAWPIATNLHVFVWNRDSVEACDFTVPFTPLDVYPDSFCRILAENCSDTGRALLDNGDGSSVAYITVEGDAGGVDVDVGDALYGNIYYTDLGNNRATGLPAATFDPTDPGAGLFDSVLLDEFPLLSSHQISFRFLQALAGDRNAASTRGIIWSATTTACQTFPIPGPVPDSNCLVGTGASGSVNYCDEAEVCTSGPRPPVNREINIFSIDAFVPGAFGTDGGYFNLQSLVAGGFGPTGGVQQLGPDLHLVGITDQEATIGGTPAVRAAYYAPRD